MNTLILRLLLVIPWLLWLWFIIRGFEGEMDGLLVFVLAIILAPLIGLINAMTLFFYHGRRFVKRAQKLTKREPIRSTNYEELPWWNPKRWL